MRSIRLSSAQVDFLRHRLEVSDAIGDALADEFHRDAVCDAAEVLLTRLSSGIIWTETKCEEAVLVDVIEGSTWVASALADCDNLKIGRYVRTAVAVEKKVSGLLGYSVVAALG